MDLEQAIMVCIAIKDGNKEFALFRWGESDWGAEIGNPSAAVSLGESSGEYYASGSTPMEAVLRLKETLQNKTPSRDDDW